jgi:hypothetical protein
MNFTGTYYLHQQNFRELIAGAMANALAMLIVFRVFLQRFDKINTTTRQALNVPLRGQWYLITTNAVPASNLRRSSIFSRVAHDLSSQTSVGSRRRINHNKRGNEA